MDTEYAELMAEAKKALKNAREVYGVAGPVNISLVNMWSNYCTACLLMAAHVMEGG